VRRLLSEPVITLRTECYLIPKSETALKKLPQLEDMEQQVKLAIDNCADLFEKVRVIVPDDQVQFAEESESESVEA
jgi:hypothetical protein